MRLVVVSHKRCWQPSPNVSATLTDGGFSFQMKAIAELFDETVVLVPCSRESPVPGVVPLEGRNMSVVALTQPAGFGLARKLGLLLWLAGNARALLREVRRADAVHVPIPGDVGTIGMLLAVALRKPLFVRHCGNWLKQVTPAERFCKWFMERFAGGRNVMLATGGSVDPPSTRNPAIQWIFSTTLTREELTRLDAERVAPNPGRARLIIACRQESEKGTARVIAAMPRLLTRFPEVTLDVVGDGAHLAVCRKMVADLNVGSRTTFHGNVDHPTLMRLFQRADLFCYPTTASEGFPKVVLEALACGLPVVTTRVSVLPHLMKNGGGLVVDDLSPDGIAAAVAACFSTSHAYQQLSRQARRTAREYSLERWRDTIGGMLESAWGRLQSNA